MAKAASGGPVGFGPTVDLVPVFNGDFPLGQHEIVITLTGFDLRNPQRSFHPPGADAQAGNAAATPFDIDARAANRPVNHGTRVTVILPNNEDLFFRPDQFYLTAGDGYSRSHLRRDAAHPTSGEPKSAIFYIRRHTQRFVSYNLGIIIREGQWQLPIYVDPKIENNG